MTGCRDPNFTGMPVEESIKQVIPYPVDFLLKHKDELPKAEYEFTSTNGYLISGTTMEKVKASMDKFIDDYLAKHMQRRLKEEINRFDLLTRYNIY